MLEMLLVVLESSWGYLLSAKCFHGRYILSTSQERAVALESSWNLGFVPLRILQFYLGSWSVVVVHRTDWTYRVHRVLIDYTRALIGSDEFKRNVTLLIRSEISNGPQNFGCSFLTPLPSSMERFCVDSHTLSPNLKAQGILELLVYCAISSFVWRYDHIQIQ